MTILFYSLIGLLLIDTLFIVALSITVIRLKDSLDSLLINSSDVKPNIKENKGLQDINNVGTYDLRFSNEKIS